MKNLLASVLAAGAVVVAAPVAHAYPGYDPSLTDVEQDYVNHQRLQICTQLQATPSALGVEVVQRQAMAFGHFDAPESVRVLGSAVSHTCSQYMPLLATAKR